MIAFLDAGCLNLEASGADRKLSAESGGSSGF